MKKTTWVIIGLSLCVVVLSAALGIVLLQQKTETSIVGGSATHTSSFLDIKPWENFSLSRRPIQNFERKGLAVYKNGNITTYVIVGEPYRTNKR